MDMACRPSILTPSTTSGSSWYAFIANASLSMSGIWAVESKKKGAMDRKAKTQHLAVMHSRDGNGPSEGSYAKVMVL